MTESWKDGGTAIQMPTDADDPLYYFSTVQLKLHYPSLDQEGNLQLGIIFKPQSASSYLSNYRLSLD